MNLNDKLNSPVGILSITEIDKKTGEESTFSECNVITAEGFTAILNNITGQVPAQTNNLIDTIRLGDDVGLGSATNPEQPTILSTSLDQDVVLTISRANLTITYPETGKFSISSVIDGEAFVDSQGVEVVNYTSATIRFENGDTLSYKRFPAKTISRLIDIRINWSVDFT